MFAFSIRQRPDRFSFNFWFYQLGGWTFYFLFTALASIDAFGSVWIAVLVNGTFTVLGMVASSGLHQLLSARWEERPLYRKLLLGALYSITASAVIISLINVKLWPYLLDITISWDNWTILFRGTVKYSFVFMAWMGLYLGGRYWREAEMRKRDAEARSAPGSDENRLSINDTIFISISDSCSFLKIGEITHIAAEDSYTRVYVKGGSSHLLLKSLKEWEKILDTADFKRVHRSCLVNVNYVRRVHKWFNNTYRIYLEGREDPIRMSRRYASELKFK